jgi:DNA-directed RNA polymerase specialized sigma24 family protein
MFEPPNKKKARNAEIMTLQAKGMTYREIASIMGISRGRVGIIVKRERARKLQGTIA